MEPAADQAVLFSPPEILDDDIDAVARVLRSGWISTGEQCQQLEEELASMVGAPHVIGVSSCTAALDISMRSLRLAPGARVGVPTWTFVASASAVVNAGGVPVLIDADPATLNVSVEATEAALAEGLDALLVVHFGGSPVAREVHDLAAARGVRVVEDAAHALGASDHRGPISGSGSVSACYSFYATKNLTSAEGGALATHDDDLARYARSQRLHGLSNDAWGRYRLGANPDYDVIEPGLKANLPDVLAVLARSQLTRFARSQARRRAIVERYRLGIGEIGGCRVVPDHADPQSADHLFVVVLPEGADRTLVAKSMAGSGVGTGVHFRPLHTFTWFAQHAPVGPAGVAVADALRFRTLSLPLHVGLTDSQVDRVLEALASALT